MDYPAHGAFSAQSSAGPSFQGHFIHQDVEASAAPFGLLESFELGDAIDDEGHAGIQSQRGALAFTMSSNEVRYFTIFFFSVGDMY